MEMTAAQIRGAMMSHKRRLNELRSLGYPDNHPLVAMHLRHLASLEGLLNQHTVGKRGEEYSQT